MRALSPKILRGSGKRAWLPILGLLALTGIAAGFRLYRLGEQSYWMDEYFSVCNLPAASLAEYLMLVQCSFPEQMSSPLFYILQYNWTQLFGLDETTVRLLPVLISLTGIPLIVIVGRYLDRPATGWFAGICLALSTQHIWFAQEPRPYSLLMPLALLSLFALLKALRGRAWPWLLLHGAANALLLWAHPFTALLWVAQGCFLLCYSERYFRFALVWGTLHAALALPWFAWMLQMPYYHEFWSDITIPEIVAHLFFTDVVSLNSDLLPPWKTLAPEQLSVLIRTLLPARPVLDTVLAAMLTCGALWCYAGAIPRVSRWMYRGEHEARQREARENHTVLVFMLILPGLTLGLLNLVLHRPFAGPMYAMYGTASIYLGAGMIWARVRSLSMRSALLGLTVLLFAYQAALFLPRPTRTDWRAAAAYLSEQGEDGDVILNLQCLFPGRFLELYMEEDIRVRRVTTFERACNLAHAHFAAGPGAETSAWVIHTLVDYQSIAPHTHSRALLESGLAARGLEVAESHLFPGHYNLVLYRVRPAAGPLPGGPFPPVPSLLPVDYEAALRDLGLASADPAEHAARLHTVRQFIPFWPPFGKIFTTLNVFDCIVAGEAELATALAEYLTREHPHYGLGHYGLGLALLQRGQLVEADAAFRRAYDRHHGLGVLTEAVTRPDDPLVGVSSEELERLEAMGYMYITRPLRTIRDRRDAARAQEGPPATATAPAAPAL